MTVSRFGNHINLWVWCLFTVFFLNHSKIQWVFAVVCFCLLSCNKIEVQLPFTYIDYSFLVRLWWNLYFSVVWLSKYHQKMMQQPCECFPGNLRSIQQSYLWKRGLNFVSVLKNVIYDETYLTCTLLLHITVNSTSHQITQQCTLSSKQMEWIILKGTALLSLWDEAMN